MNEATDQERLKTLEQQVALNKKEIEQDNADENKEATRDKLRNGLLGVIALFLALGQWGDTVDVCERLYGEVVSNFTNKIEYNKLSEINIGITRNFLHGVMGEPKVEKFSRIDGSLRYQYFFDEKFLLISAFREQRLVSYVVIGLEEGFYPEVPYQSETFQLKNQFDFVGEAISGYVSDYNNLEFYIDFMNLGKDAMYMSEGIGYVNYSGLTSGYSQDLKNLESTDLDDDSGVEILHGIRKRINPNMFAVTETDPEVISDMLLTKYEFKRLKI